MCHWGLVRQPTTTSRKSVFPHKLFFNAIYGAKWQTKRQVMLKIFSGVYSRSDLSTDVRMNVKHRINTGEHCLMNEEPIKCHWSKDVSSTKLFRKFMAKISSSHLKGCGHHLSCFLGKKFILNLSLKFTEFVFKFSNLYLNWFYI